MKKLDESLFEEMYQEGYIKQEEDMRSKGKEMTDVPIDWEEYVIICTHEKLIKNVTNKQYNSYSQGCVMGYVDNGGDEMYKYLYGDDIEVRREQLLKEGIKVPSLRMLKRDFKILNEIGYIDLVNTPNGLCYRFQLSEEGKYFTTISLYRWRRLMTWTNKYMLRLYAIFSISCNTKEYKQLTRAYFCKALGMDINEGNLKYIGIQIDGLRRLGVIDVKQVHENILLEDGKTIKNVTHNKYRLTTDEEFRQK